MEYPSDFIWSGFACVAVFEGILPAVFGLKMTIADDSKDRKQRDDAVGLRCALLVGNFRIFDSIFPYMLSIQQKNSQCDTRFENDKIAFNLALFRREQVRFLISVQKGLIHKIQVDTLTPILTSQHLCKSVDSLLNGSTVRAPTQKIRFYSRQLFGTKADFPADALYGPLQPRWDWLESVVWNGFIEWWRGSILTSIGNSIDCFSNENIIC